MLKVEYYDKQNLKTTKLVYDFDRFKQECEDNGWTIIARYRA